MSALGGDGMEIGAMDIIDHADAIAHEIAIAGCRIAQAICVVGTGDQAAAHALAQEFASFALAIEQAHRACLDDDDNDNDSDGFPGSFTDGLTEGDNGSEDERTAPADAEKRK